MKKETYFISDLHLNQKKAIELYSRPFKNIEEMNDTIIQNINDLVKKEDELWVLGDFGHGDRNAVRVLRDCIECENVHLVRGNHDKNYSNDDIFQSCREYKELKTEYGRFILFHYPISEWNTAHYGSVHLHGHIHSMGDEYNRKNLKQYYRDRVPPFVHPASIPELHLRIFDVGVDANDFRPVSLSELAELMQLEPIRKNSRN